eukprot:scaffold1402_cov403-Prasinococcus_capsulatus_cf.AAC.14
MGEGAEAEGVVRARPASGCGTCIAWASRPPGEHGLARFLRGCGCLLAEPRVDQSKSATRTQMDGWMDVRDERRGGGGRGGGGGGGGAISPASPEEGRRGGLAYLYSGPSALRSLRTPSRRTWRPIVQCLARYMCVEECSSPRSG